MSRRRTQPASNLAPATEPPAELYDADYFEQRIHRRHWFRDNPAKYRMRWDAVLRMLQPQPGDRVVDLGCAAGAHALRVAPLVAEVVGVDNSPAAIDAARRRGADCPNVRFEVADACDLASLDSGSFDKAMAIDFLEHIDDAALDRLQHAVWRVLRPGGRFVFYTPSATHYVERMKARNVVLRQLEGHIAVRSLPHYRAIFDRMPWRIVDQFTLPSTYPVFGLLDRALGALPLFQFRICMALERPGAA